MSTATQRPQVPSMVQLLADKGLASASVTALKALRDEIGVIRKQEQALTEVLKQYIALSGDEYGEDARCLRDDLGNCAVVKQQSAVRYGLADAAQYKPEAVVEAARANVLTVKDSLVEELRGNGMGLAWADALWQYREVVKGGGAQVLSFERSG